ncbi:MAG: Abi family protein [Clostridiales bacterium]|jgi:abortive infection bacteriophage resistance protein|nr:Abi family protein [Clostridiales bacterium]
MEKKPFKSLDEQIELLISRGLVISDKDKAKFYLRTCNYYNLVNGYKEPFVIKGTDKYIPGVKIGDLKALYDFDEWLRGALMPLLLSAENTLKTAVTYEFTKKYGASGYLNADNFNVYNEKQKESVKRLLSEIERNIEDALQKKGSRFDCIKHYEKNYKEIPLWVLCNILTFNNIQWFYSCMKPSDKRDVCKYLYETTNIELPNRVLDGVFFLCVDMRNTCAHGQRLYNYTSKIRLPAENILADKIKTYSGKRIEISNLFLIPAALCYLMSDKKFTEFLENFVVKITKIKGDMPLDIFKNIVSSMRIEFADFFDVLLGLLAIIGGLPK